MDEENYNFDNSSSLNRSSPLGDLLPLAEANNDRLPGVNEFDLLFNNTINIDENQEIFNASNNIQHRPLLDVQLTDFTSNRIVHHTKFSEDNMMTKIKIYIIYAILSLLNNSFIHLKSNTTSSKNRNFLKIEPSIYNTIKKDNNLRMLKMTVKNLLYNNINDKISKVDKAHNKKLIDEIYSQQIETDVIKILDLTFEEFLNFFRGTISTELEEKLSLITNIKKNLWI